MWKGLKFPAYKKRWQERLSIFSFPQLATAPIWIHTVSVGEFIAAIPLIKQLQKRYPEVPLLVTTMTPTGSDRVRAVLGESVQHVYLPYDIPFLVKRFLIKVKPQIALIFETEIWPNWYYYSAQKAIPLFLVNARMSAQSAKGYQRVSAFTKEILSCTTKVFAQSKADAEQFKQLGLQADKLHITGNIKFDLTIPDEVLEKGQLLRKQLHWETSIVWIAASTHAGEETMILQVFEQLRQEHGLLRLILVPRHPERFNKVAEMIRQYPDYHLIRRSEGEKQISATADIFLGDSMGELLIFYACADKVFMGGSLVNIGGHNILEPAALGKTIFFGPYMRNFQTIATLFLQRNAALQVNDVQQLQVCLLSNTSKQQQIAQEGRKIMQENKGVVEQIVTLLTPYINARIVDIL